MKQVFLARFCFLFQLVFLSFLGACAANTSTPEEGRLSAAANVLHNSASVTAWLDNPNSLSYIEAYVSFPPETGSDVVLGIDQEFIDGVDKPLFLEGGDWMGLVGLQRTGKVWVARGTADTIKGNPSSDRSWQVVSLGQPLQPNTWYHIRTVIDFRSRHYVSFAIMGANINQIVDLRAYTLDYPNYLPFDGRALGNFVFAMRGKAFMTEAASGAVAYFGNVGAGIVPADGKDRPFLQDDLKSHGDRIEPIGVPLSAFFGGSIPLENVKDDMWYREQDDARVRILPVPGAKNGEKVIKCDATLQPVSYDEWLNSK